MPVTHPLTEPQIRSLQGDLNNMWTKLRLPGGLVNEDGQWGGETAQRVVQAKFYIGYHDADLNSHVDDRLVGRVKHPTGALVQPFIQRRGRERRKKARVTGTLRARAFKVAEGLIGVMEHGGNNVGPMVSQIIRQAGGSPGEPWCGYFNDYCYTLAGSSIAKTRVWGWYDQFGNAGFRETSSPKQGDLVVFNFGHTGMFDHDNGDGSITTVEGNTGASGAVSDSSTGGDGVYRKHRQKSLVKRYLEVVE